MSTNTQRSRILRIKKWEDIIFKIFLFECNFWYAYVLISYMNLTGLKAIEASDPAMITQLKAVLKKKKKKRKKKCTKLHYEN